MAETNGKKYPDDWETTTLASKLWLHNYEHAKKLAARTPEYGCMVISQYLKSTDDPILPPQFLNSHGDESRKYIKSGQWDADLVGYDVDGKWTEAKCVTTAEYKDEIKNVDGFALYIGSCAAAAMVETMKEHQIGAVINMAVSGCTKEFGYRFQLAKMTRDLPICSASNFSEDDYRCLGMKFLMVDAQDKPEYRISDHFKEINAFLKQCREDGLRTLVYCVGGCNRSAAACASFLADPKGGIYLSVDEAIRTVGRRRNLSRSLHTVVGSHFMGVKVESKPKHGVLSNPKFIEELLKTYGWQNIHWQFFQTGPFNGSFRKKELTSEDN